MTNLALMLFAVNTVMAIAMIIWTAKMQAKFKETPTEAHKKKKWGTDPDVPVPHFDASLRKGYADLRIMAEHEKRKMAVKEFTDLRTNREIASGMVIDPGGTCLCRRCGHTVSAVSDRCDQCNNKLDWNA